MQFQIRPSPIESVWPFWRNQNTNNGLKQKLRRNFSEAAICSLRYDYFRQNHNKTCEKNETDGNFEEKNSESQVELNSSNLSQEKFKFNSLFESLIEITCGFKNPNKFILSQMLLPIAVLKGLSGSRESAVSALSSKMMSPEFKKKYFYNINKKFTSILENNQYQQFRSMSSNNPMSISALLKNDIMLSNKCDKSHDSVILNVTVSIPLSDLNKDKRSNKLSCSAKIDDILKLPADNQNINEKNVSPMKYYKNSVAPIKIENHDRVDFNKGKSKKLCPYEKMLHGDSTTQKSSEEFRCKLLKKKSKIDTVINECETRIRHEKVKNINKHMKMLTQNSWLSSEKKNQMVEHVRKEEPNSTNNIQMSQKIKNDDEEVKVVTPNSQLSPADKINQMIEKDCEHEQNYKSYMQMSHDTGSESYSKWLGRKRTEVKTAEKEKVKKTKKELSFSCPGEEEKEIFMKKRLNDLEEPEYYDSVTTKPIKDKERLTVKSVLNNSRILYDNKKFEKMSDSHIIDQKFKGKPWKSELFSHSLKYYPRKNSEEMIYRTKFENQSIGRYKVSKANNRFLDWRDQCSNINEPVDELSYSLSDFKTRRSPSFNNVNTRTKKIYKKRNVTENEFEQNRWVLKEYDSPQKIKLQHTQTSSKPLGENVQNNVQNIENYQQKNNLSVENYKTDINKSEDKSLKNNFFTENKQAVTKGPQINKILPDNTQQKEMKKENKQNYRKQRTKVIQSEINYKKIKSDLSTHINDGVNENKKQNFHYPIRNTVEKKTKLFELTGTDNGTCLTFPQNKSLKLSRKENSPQSQRESKIQISKEEQIAIKTAEFCKILLELVKLFSISVMKDIERSNKLNEK